MHNTYLEKRTQFKPVNLNVRDYLGNLCDKERIILKWVFRKQCVTMWTRSSGSGHVPATDSCQHDMGTFNFHNWRGISLLAQLLLDSQERLWSEDTSLTFRLYINVYPNAPKMTTLLRAVAKDISKK
jgi:hypothetical protein